MCLFHVFPSNPCTTIAHTRAHTRTHTHMKADYDLSLPNPDTDLHVHSASANDHWQDTVQPDTHSDTTTHQRGGSAGFDTDTQDVTHSVRTDMLTVGVDMTSDQTVGPHVNNRNATHSDLTHSANFVLSADAETLVIDTEKNHHDSQSITQKMRRRRKLNTLRTHPMPPATYIHTLLYAAFELRE